MDAILIRSRYKVTHIQYAQDQYAALQAVDLESREKREYLLNVYEGELVKSYVDSFDRLRHCAAYHGLFMDQGNLVALFDAVGGTPIDQGAVPLGPIYFGLSPRDRLCRPFER